MGKKDGVEFTIKAKHFQHFKANHGPFKGMPPVTSCTIVTKEGRTARGISICSVEDGYNIVDGKSIAYRKALRALKGRGEQPIVRKEAIAMLLTTNCPYTYGAELKPDLSFQEKCALYGRKDVLAGKHNEKPISFTFTHNYYRTPWGAFSDES